MVAQIPIDRDRIAEFCKRHHIRKLSLFGSVLRDDFRPDSDVDVLAEFEPEHPRGWEVFGLSDELTDMLGRRVDFVDVKNLLPRIADRVLNAAEPIFGPPFLEHRDMSEANKPKDYTVLCDHILEVAREASRAVTGKTRDAFDANLDLQHATAYRLQTIGEAARNIPQPIRDKAPGIPWAQIVGMRHRIAHDYIHVDYDTVWNVATVELGPLIEQIEKLKRELGG